MRTSALAAFPAWISQFEGDLPRPYLDVRGLATVGIGLLCPLATALTLSWTLAGTGAPATDDDVREAYAALEALPAGRGGGWYQSRVGIVATTASLQALFATKVATFERWLRSSSPIGAAWDSLPAVAQLARMRTCWAVGCVAWPHQDAAIARGDWAMAAQECMPSDLLRQPAEYRQSYQAVRELYLLAAEFPGDELPEPLPSGATSAA
jgi:hypothetical protein